MISLTRGAGDHQLAGEVSEAILDVTGGQPSRVHLGDQALEHLGVAGEEGEQLGMNGSADPRTCTTWIETLPSAVLIREGS